MLLSLGGGGFCCCCSSFHFCVFISFLYLHFIFDLHFVVIVLHFISKLLFHVTGTPPWLFRPVKVSTSSELYLDYFWLLCFCIYCESYGFGWAFFTLCSFTDIFDSTCIYQGLPGSRQFFLEVFRASYWSSKHKPGSSVCLIYSNS